MHRVVLACYARNRRLVDARTQWAFSAIIASLSARAFYDQRVAPGDPRPPPYEASPTDSSAASTHASVTPPPTTNSRPARTASPAPLDNSPWDVWLATVRCWAVTSATPKTAPLGLRSFAVSKPGRSTAVQLEISGAHTGLASAIDALLLGGAWQRWRVHFMRKVLAKIPRASGEMVAAAIRTIFAQRRARSGLSGPVAFCDRHDESGFMSVFSSDPFLTALAETYFGDEPAEIGFHALGGKTYRLLCTGRPLAGRRAIRPLMGADNAHFVHYWEPTDATATSAIPTRCRVRYLPSVHRETIEAHGSAPDLKGLGVAPFLRFDEFASWEDLRRRVSQRRSTLAADSRRMLRRLEREIGPVSFTFNEWSHDAVDACIEWKSAQFPGVRQVFRDSRHREFLCRLHDAGVVQVSSIRAGDYLLAVNVGLDHERRSYYLLPSYDPEHRKHAPGRLLMEYLIEETFSRGYAEFDLLMGAEEYKWVWATHARLLGPVGLLPVSAWLPTVRGRLRLRTRLRSIRRRVAIDPARPAGSTVNGSSGQAT